MAKPKFVNLHHKPRGRRLVNPRPKGDFVNEWEVTFKTTPTKARINAVLSKLLRTIYEHDYDDCKTVLIEYEWSRWVNVPLKYSLYIYRTAVDMKPAEKAAIAKLRQKRAAKIMKANNNTEDIPGVTADAEGTATSTVNGLASGGPQPTGPQLPRPEVHAALGGPQTSGPQIPPPPGTATVERKDLEPITDPPTL